MSGLRGSHSFPASQPFCFQLCLPRGMSTCEPIEGGIYPPLEDSTWEHLTYSLTFVFIQHRVSRIQNTENYLPAARFGSFELSAYSFELEVRSFSYRPTYFLINLFLPKPKTPNKPIPNKNIVPGSGTEAEPSLKLSLSILKLIKN